MQAGDGEAGQTGKAALAVDQDAEDQDGGEQQQRNDAGGAAGVPERGGPAHLTCSCPVALFLSCRVPVRPARPCPRPVFTLSIFGARARRILQVSSGLALSDLTIPGHEASRPR